MFSRRRAQSAVEFMLIFLFIFVIVSVAIYILGYFTQDIIQNQNQAEVDNFAKSIESEIALLQRVSNGYNRSVLIPDYLALRYNVTLRGEYLVLRPVEIEGDDTLTELWYPLPSAQPYFIVDEDRDGDTVLEKYLVLYRNQSTDSSIQILT